MLRKLITSRTLIVEAIRQGILWAVVMGFVTITPEQHDQTIAFASVLLALISTALEPKADA
jgi:prephenate dehydrogenase